GEAVARALHWVGLEHRARAYPAELSGGERRRVTIACLWLADPLVTLLDEPTAGLDAPRRAEFLDLLLSRHDESRAVVMVTHDLVAALHACTRVVFMHAGRVVADHPAAEVQAAAHPAARRLLETL
ncbi:MAG: amino acid ABC transporter ATP-binding protein, partial [Deltaproteobacteria bacterium]|nr:amino acid ABC transporter ATP-binding protein [Deltaproteobacteria bacterium]